MKFYFFHGFLGTTSDFLPLIQELKLCPHDIELVNLQTWDFEHFKKEKSKQVILVGYSMGGRVAMNLALREWARTKISGMVILSAHLGLSDEKERKERYEYDRQLLTNINDQASFRQFLRDWYQQKLFALNEDEQKELVNQRSRESFVFDYHDRFSAGQLAPVDLAQLTIPYLYLAGERDEKYCQIAKAVGGKILPHCGHNVLWKNEARIAAEIRAFVSTIASDKHEKLA